MGWNRARRILRIGDLDHNYDGWSFDASGGSVTVTSLNHLSSIPQEPQPYWGADFRRNTAIHCLFLVILLRNICVYSRQSYYTLLGTYKMLPEQTSILIVGAGPTGLSAAISLFNQGCKDIVIVDAAERTPDTSRAMAIHAATLEVGLSSYHYWI